MKYTFITRLLFICCLFNTSVFAQSEEEKLNLPGDNLNLYAALKLFQDSKTLEGFEKSLNSENSKINNLDLNGDDKIDYIRVVDNVQGNVHNISLKVAVGKDQDQNVAVFVVTREKDGPAKIQVIGDEDLYGKDYIIEPNDEATSSTPNPGYKGNSAADNTANADQEDNSSWSQVSDWPLVRYIYVPSYTGWNSPWYWDYYPSYWQPWRPFYWHYYYGYQYHWNYYYNAHYRRWNNYIVPGWQQQYYGSSFRSRAPVVQIRYNRGDFNRTYARPALAVKGAEMFRRENPTAPSVNDPLPNFDKTGRPIITRQPGKPVNPVSSRPAVTAPVTRPETPNEGRQPGTKPVVIEPGTKPAVIEPAKPAVVEPGINSAKEPVRRPVTRPGNEAEPVSRPVANQPAPNPANNLPATRPVVSEPATRPVANEPVRKPVANEPATRPAITPSAPQPVPGRPVTREPVNPPSSRPGRTEPVTRPDNRRPATNNSFNRPAETRQPVINRPVFTRPAPVNPPAGATRSGRPRE